MLDHNKSEVHKALKGFVIQCPCISTFLTVLEFCRKWVIDSWLRNAEMRMWFISLASFEGHVLRAATIKLRLWKESCGYLKNNEVDQTQSDSKV